MILTKRQTILILALLAGVGLLVLGQEVLAAIPGASHLPTGPAGLEGDTFETTIKDTVIPRITNLVYVIGLMVAVFALIWGGYIFLMSQGESEKVNEAKTIVTWSIIGIITIVLANSIVQLILTTNYNAVVEQEIEESR